MSSAAEKLNQAAEKHNSKLRAAYEKVKKSKKADDHKQFSTTFSNSVAEMTKSIGSFELPTQEQLDAANARAAAAEREADMAERDVREIEEEAEALERELRGLLGGNVESNSTSALCAFYTKRADLAAEMTVKKAIVSGYLKAPHGFSGGLDERDAISMANAWEDNLHSLHSRATRLKEEEAANGWADGTGDVMKLYRDLEVMGPAFSARVQEKQEKASKNAKQLEDFVAEHTSLLHWCRQQKTNLDAMNDPDHIQEFCASLQNSFPTMEDNFSVLFDIGEKLLPNSQVQSGFVELNEVYLNLQISAYERLRHVLLEIHPNSKLEDEVRAFAAYSEKAGQFLQEVMKILSLPTDAESAAVLKPVMESCARLISLYPTHASLTDLLGDFSLRMECLRDNYRNLRRTVFGRLTFLTQSVPSLSTSYRRKEEYLDKMRELKRWVDVKSQGDTWADVLGRIQKIRAVVDEGRQFLRDSEEQQQ